MDSIYLLPDRTRLACRGMKWFALAVAVLIVSLSFTSDMTSKIIEAHWNSLAPDVREAVTYTPAKKWLLHGLAAISYFSLLLIVFGTARVFAAFQKGTVFSSGAVKAVRFLGLLIFVFAAIQLLIPTLIVLGLTFDNADGLRTLTLSINTSGVILLMIGTVILVIGQILTQAMKIAEENGQFI